MRLIIPVASHKCSSCQTDISKREKCYILLKNQSRLMYPKRIYYCEPCGKKILYEGCYEKENKS